LYTIGNFGSKGLSILLLPFYTRVLTQVEYGMIDMILTSLILLAPFVSVNMAESVFRFAADKNASKEEVLNTGIVISLFVFIVVLMFYPVYCYFLDQDKILLLFCVLLLLFVIQAIVKQYVRAIEKLKIYVYSDFLQILVFIGLVVYFMAVLELGVYGFLYAKIISLLVDLMYLYIASRSYETLSHGINILYGKEMLNFGIPLIPNSILWWVSNMSDRYFLASMSGLSSVGIYAVANKFPTILAVFNTVFFKAWQSSAIEQDDARDSDEYHTKVFNTFAAFMFLLASGIIVFIKPLMAVAVSSDFYEAWEYVPALLLGTVFSVFAAFLGMNYMLSKKDTKKALLSTVIAAVLNIILNIVLIPLYGVHGAVFATLISFITIFAIRAYEAPLYKKLLFDWFLIATSFFIFTTQSVILFLIDSYIVLVLTELFLLGLLLILTKQYILARILKKLKND
jgi:O-antigen/teichoic acid export membrane protein